MTERQKQLCRRINATEVALNKEKQKNNKKLAHIGWFSQFRKRYVGPSYTREHALENRLRSEKQELWSLLEGGDAA